MVIDPQAHRVMANTSTKAQYLAWTLKICRSRVG